ncbi:AAA family ATPase [Azospirillum brasilense]|uniref:AAA family ATPase n=1 Tax=Azospirillum brasilense TaxID=192 RepID=UPI000E686FB6|nr:AAA family ATPase [Azospirillum brasilense]NUB23355.1 AAA family ATPase [Azospirillum brasilense]NUB30977.1 AAA family ATPase [Azospirillum brasilense]RIW05642.1 AAA family ATPase [Azospirillum brasilense]
MDFLMTLLVRGVSDDSVSESIEFDLLEQAVVDGLLKDEDVDGFKVELACTRGASGTQIADRYLLGTMGRRDHNLGVQWHFLAGVYGSTQSARFCARWLAAQILEAVSRADDVRSETGRMIGHPWLVEAMCAVSWWTAWSGREAEALNDPRTEHKYFVAATPAVIMTHAVEGLRARGGRSLKDFLLRRGRSEAEADEIVKPKPISEERKAKLQRLRDESIERKLKQEAERSVDAVATKAGTIQQGLSYDPHEGWGDEPEDPLVGVVTYAPSEAPTLRPAIDPIVTSKSGGVPEQFAVLNEHLPLPVVEDIDGLEAAFRAEFPYADVAIRTIMRDLKIGRRWGRQAFLIRPTLLVGPPGTGKTRFINRLGAMSGVRTRVISCAGSADNRDLDGTSRGFSSATPSYLTRFFASESVAGGIIGFDEIDKASAGNQNGSIRDSLINLLERQNSYHDQYLQSRLDLSGMSFLATANDVSRLPMPLLSRFRIVEVPAPGAEHLHALVRGIRIDLAGEYGIDPRLLPELDEIEMEAVERHYRKNRSIRSLRRAVEVVMDFHDRNPVLN